MTNHPLRVLIVEDEPDYRMLLRDLLAQIPDISEDVTEAGTVTEAEVALTVRSFDIVLLDLKLPNGQGVATLRRILDVRAVAPIVVLTGAPSEADAIECLRAGAQGYVPKEHLQKDSLRRLILHAIARYEGVQTLISERARILAEVSFRGVR